MVYIHKLNDIPIDFSKYSFGKPEKGDGFWAMYVSTKDDHDNDTNLFFQSPKMTFSTEFETNDKETVDDHAHPDYVDLSCDNDDFIQLINSLDECFMSAIKSNAEEWFPGKNIDDTFLEVGQVKNLRKGNLMKFTVTDETETFNSDREAIDIRTIQASQSVKVLIELVGLWFTTNRWGVMWKIAQMKLYAKPKKNIRGYMFPDDEEPEVVKHILRPPPGV